MEGIVDCIIVDGDLTISDVQLEDIRLETAGFNPMEVETLVEELEVAMSFGLAMVLEAEFVLRTYLVEKITETMAFAVEIGEADAANLMG